ncbi:hypothetical protein COU76_04310 [Candidatus Peregrinibacteria bacterium CG10_big_fil_rev_8_21_14_0_10_49_10]|nr:MAG: hypothetical protein COU76_04310 [Candidatus Peregrinibacteria bacterium CG10_big_fil_rev_8_21_14_0_10_49_10]
MLTPTLLSYFFYQFLLPSTVLPTAEESLTRGQLTVVLEQSPIRSLQPGAQRVPMLSLRFTASCSGDAEIRSVRVRRKGLGSSEDILSVYALEGNQRLTQGTHLSREGYTTLRFRGVVVPPCGTTFIDVSADFSPDAAIAGEHSMTVERAEDIDAGTVHVALVRKSSSSVPTRAVGPVRGNIAVSYLTVRTPVRYGTQRTLQRLQLQADGKEDHLIHSITFTNRGSARNADLQNLFLQAGRNRQVSRVEQKLSGDSIRFILDPPLLLQKNQTRLLELKADVRASRSHTINLLIEEPSDVESEKASLR